MGETSVVTTIVVRDQEFPVTLDIWKGREQASATFRAEVNGKSVSSDTLERLRDALMRETRRQAVKVSIPFERVEKMPGGYPHYGKGYRSRTGIVTGLHAATGKPLVRWDDGKSEQWESRATMLRPLSASDRAALIRLRNEQDEGQRAINEIEQRNEFDVREAVNAAIAAETGGKP